MILPVAEDQPGFCDIEEKRKFSQEELDWRAENAPWNLRRDHKTNRAWDEVTWTDGETNGVGCDAYLEHKKTKFLGTSHAGR